MNEDELDFFDDGPPDSSELPDVEEMIEETESEVSPSDYTQHMLLSYLVSNAPMWVRCEPILKERYFDREYKPVVRYIEGHLKKYKSMPNVTQIHSRTGVMLNFHEDAKTKSNEEWLCDSVEEFCRTQAYKEHIIKAAEIIGSDGENKGISRDDLAQLQKEAAQIEQISLHLNLGSDVHKDTALILAETQHDDNISTGFSHLDLVLSGGVSRPSFNIISCASGDGKSIFMQNILVNAAERGENCIFYSLELGPPTIHKRFGAMMTDTAMDNVYGHIDTVANTLRVRSKTDGFIKIVKMPMGGTTISHIASHYLQLTMQTGLHFGVVAIDYLDLMYPVEPIERSNLHLKDKYVSEEVNEWIHQNHLIGWSASQQTKGAQDEAVARQSGVGGGVGKVHTCDNLIIGKRSDEDKEDERWWGHIEKNRDGGGTKRKFPLYWNSQTQRMIDGDMDLFEEANPTLFGRKRSKDKKPPSHAQERISNDAIAKELGVEMPETEKPESGRSVKATDTLERLKKMQKPPQLSTKEGEEGNDKRE